MGAKEKLWVKYPDDYMATKDFLPGDHLLIDPDKEPKPGSYVLAELAGKWHLSKLVRGKKALRLKSLKSTKNYVDVEFFNIIGVVVKMSRDVLSPYTSKTS